MRYIVYVLIITLIGNQLMAQNEETPEIKSIHDLFKYGEMDFHARIYWMNTQNRGDRLDYSALAAGGGLGYHTPYFHGFSVGMSGFFIFKLHSRNLDKPDPLTGGLNRYEVTLFDMHDPANSKDLDRLEELYISYRKQNIKIKIGRQFLETPLLNGQDNRMRPNLFSGIHVEYALPKAKILSSWIDRVSPRGTVDWYDINTSMGVYPFGRNIDGQASLYKDNTTTSGILINGIESIPGQLEYKLFNYYADNLFNLLYSEAIYKLPVTEMQNFTAGIQSFWQTAIGNGGNTDPGKSYISNNEQTFGVGWITSWQQRINHFSLRGLYIHDTGRFLFPREWGREQFWANLPRERFEGNGGLMSLAARWEMDPDNDNWDFMFGAGITKTQNPFKAALNKYGMPSYYHLAGSWILHLPGFFEGVYIQTLIVYKGRLDRDPIPESLAINRIDMWNCNLIIDYKF